MLRFLSVFNVSTKQCSALLFSCYLFCSSLNHEGLQIFDRLCSAKLFFNYFTFLLMDVSYRHSASLIFRLLSILLKSQFWNYLRVSVDYTCKCNAEISLWFSMSPLNSALLCFSRASCFVQVSIMKVFKSSINYALRNFVSNLSLFFWWISPICTALLWFFACFLFCSSLNIETIWEFRWTAFANVMLRFLSVFNVSTKQCSALLFWCYLFCSSLNHEGLQIFDRLCSAKLCFNYFTFLLMDFSYWHSASLIFRLLSILLKSQYWKYLRVSVDYTCKCNVEISLWFSMSPLNCALLCFSRASCFVQVSIMKVFKSSIDYVLRDFVSNLSLVFWWKFSIGTALLCFSLSSYIVQVSISKLFESFGWLLLIWFWTFLCCFHGSLLSAQRCFDFHVLPILFKSQCWNISRVSVDYTCKCNAEISLRFSMSPLNRALLCFFCAIYSVQVSIMKVFKSSIDYALRNFVSIISLFFWCMSPIGTALLWFFACFLFGSSLNIETIWEFRWTTLANVMLRFLFGFQCLH